MANKVKNGLSNLSSSQFIFTLNLVVFFKYLTPQMCLKNDFVLKTYLHMWVFIWHRSKLCKFFIHGDFMQRTEQHLLKIPLKDHAKDFHRIIFTQLRSLIWLGSVSFDKLYQNACLEYWSTFERFLWDEISKKTILSFWLIIYFQCV